MLNIDMNEKRKFDALGQEWWETRGSFRALHDINPVRITYINERAGLKNQSVVDVGCGGGLLTEGMARMGACVTGIDISAVSLTCARQHCMRSGLPIQYDMSSPEEYAARMKHQFDIITCMEMLEHVPDPQAVVNACAQLARPGGHLFFSTLNRTARAYMLAILGAEHLLKLLPAGTHHYAGFIRPSELAAWCRQSGLEIMDITGILYIPFFHKAVLTGDTGVNYLLHARLPGN